MYEFESKHGANVNWGPEYEDEAKQAIRNVIRDVDESPVLLTDASHRNEILIEYRELVVAEYGTGVFDNSRDYTDDETE